MQMGMDLLTERVINVFHRMLAQDRMMEREECVLLGTYLFKSIFHGDIKKKFDDVYNAIGESTLRVVLSFDENSGRLATLPWEYLFYPEDDRGNGWFIASRSNLILSRYVPLKANARLKPIDGPLRVLLVVSDPKDDEGLLGAVNPDGVISAIRSLKTTFGDLVKIDEPPLLQPTRETFGKKINEFKPHILHFIGHGTYEQSRYNVLFVKGIKDERPDPVSDRKFADFFIEYQPRLIFLHCCHGAASDSYGSFRGVALQLVYSSKVPAVIAMQYEIENEVATEFAKTFYTHIASSDPLDVAAQHGRMFLYNYLTEEHSYSRRAFGSPVIFLQIRDPILLNKAKGPNENDAAGPMKDSEPVYFPCPNRDCRKKVLEGDTVCYECRHKIGRCPHCKNFPISMTNRICLKCNSEITEQIQTSLESTTAKEKISNLQGIGFEEK